jgi:hypothetical protein
MGDQGQRLEQSFLRKSFGIYNSLNCGFKSWDMMNTNIKNNFMIVHLIMMGNNIP